MREIRTRKTPNTATFHAVSFKAEQVPVSVSCCCSYTLRQYLPYPSAQGYFDCFPLCYKCKEIWCVAIRFFNHIFSFKSILTEIFQKEATVKKFPKVSGKHQRRSSVFLFSVHWLCFEVCNENLYYEHWKCRVTIV